MSQFLKNIDWVVEKKSGVYKKVIAQPSVDHFNKNCILQFVDICCHHVGPYIYERTKQLFNFAKECSLIINVWSMNQLLIADHNIVKWSKKIFVFIYNLQPCIPYHWILARNFVHTYMIHFWISITKYVLKFY